jgi:hypothetical protein
MAATSLSLNIFDKENDASCHLTSRTPHSKGGFHDQADGLKNQQFIVILVSEDALRSITPSRG